MYIKIYFDDKPVFLCDELTPELSEILHHPDAVLVDETSAPAINAFLHEIKKEQFHAGVMVDKDFKKLKKAFFHHFAIIEAAGGIVQNSAKEFLFIHRLGKWDLPKGKIEEGEDLEECAIREVEEETNTTDLTIKKKVGETYHAYHAYGKHYLKTSHWYYMTCPADQQSTPQTEENITAVKWVHTKEIRKLMENTYPSIKDILDIFFDKKETK
jgi:8-oxo-dGTP pyrophosphatase MutT (NUDIX family)